MSPSKSSSPSCRCCDETSMLYSPNAQPHLPWVAPVAAGSLVAANVFSMECAPRLRWDKGLFAALQHGPDLTRAALQSKVFLLRRTNLEASAYLAVPLQINLPTGIGHVSCANRPSTVALRSSKRVSCRKTASPATHLSDVMGVAMLFERTHD